VRDLQVVSRLIHEEHHYYNGPEVRLPPGQYSYLIDPAGKALSTGVVARAERLMNRLPTKHRCRWPGAMRLSSFRGCHHLSLMG
jgi:hypothetical protein